MMEIPLWHNISLFQKTQNRLRSFLLETPDGGEEFVMAYATPVASPHNSNEVAGFVLKIGDVERAVKLSDIRLMTYGDIRDRSQLFKINFRDFDPRRVHDESKDIMGAPDWHTAMRTLEVEKSSIKGYRRKADKLRLVLLSKPDGGQEVVVAYARPVTKVISTTLKRTVMKPNPGKAGLMGLFRSAKIPVSKPAEITGSVMAGFVLKSLDGTERMVDLKDVVLMTHSSVTLE